MFETSVDEDLITPERYAKGDLQVAFNTHGKISKAIPLELTIVKELIRRRIFPHHYEIYGTVFLELRAAFRSVNGCRSAAVLLEQWGIGVSENNALQMYQHVSRRMKKHEIDIVEYTMNKIERRLKTVFLAGGKERRTPYLENYRKTYDTLVVIIDEERKNLSDQK
jgi:hypothetical protein